MVSLLSLQIFFFKNTALFDQGQQTFYNQDLSRLYEPETGEIGRKLKTFLIQLEEMAILSLPSTEKPDEGIELMLVKCVLKASAILYLAFISSLFTFSKSGLSKSVSLKKIFRPNS